MKEFDFDELDKAVNSLMADAKVKGEANSETEVAPEDKPVLELAGKAEMPAALSPVLASDKPAETPAPVLEPAPALDKAPEAPAPKPTGSEGSKPITPPRRSGRFMDVVHPSSDMRPTLRTHGDDPVAPISPSVAPEVTAVSETPEASNPETASEPVETFEPSDPSPALNDPIAFEEKKKDAEAESPATQEAIEPMDLTALLEAPAEEPDAATSSLPEAETEQPSSESMAGSPFLTDAKVEKRPLNSGAMSLAETAEVAPVDKADDDPVPQPQPAELGSDILAVESGIVSASPLESAADDEPKPSYKGVTTTSALTGQESVSIAQQYKEQPSSTPEEHAAMYDSAAHPALEHPAKKRSGWLVVLWVVLLLVVGAGGAAALYMLKVI